MYLKNRCSNINISIYVIYIYTIYIVYAKFTGVAKKNDDLVQSRACFAFYPLLILIMGVILINQNPTQILMGVCHLKYQMMTKGRVDNRDVWGSKEENHSTSSSSLLYCKTKHHLRLGILERPNIDTHHMRLVLIPSQVADDDSLINKNKEYANILH